jgi:hypothetical protein
MPQGSVLLSGPSQAMPFNACVSTRRCRERVPPPQVTVQTVHSDHLELFQGLGGWDGKCGIYGQNLRFM